ncbi:MAG: glycoside hydrolase 43 family protein [Planctomycetia bacterium]|nr:glycoside hydrolase 43 family protein [Planctomycetia bacterium]
MCTTIERHVASDLTMTSMRRLTLSLAFAIVLSALVATSSAQEENAHNPMIWADVPDVAPLRVADQYYMSSTTMFYYPGVPIMQSSDLVNWNIVGYVDYQVPTEDELQLLNGKHAYGRGTWASSLRFHNGQFYLAVFSGTTGYTYIYSSPTVDGEWKMRKFKPMCHDCSLFFDKDDTPYLIYGNGNLRLTELKKDLTGFQPNGIDEVIVRNAGAVAGGRIGLNAEGSQIFERNGKYYLCNITWPQGDMRTEIVHVADSIRGPYTGSVLFKDRGIAQGSLLECSDGSWAAIFFRDAGAVGRIPYLMPVKWDNDVPIVGVDGKAPETLNVPRDAKPLGNIVHSDEFQRDDALLQRLAQNAQKDEPEYPRDALPLAWQWNHYPDMKNWSLHERPGWLRLRTSRVDQNLQQTRNILTQRVFGPTCYAQIKLDAANMLEGDRAGLSLFQRKYGCVEVEKRQNKLYVVQREAVLQQRLEEDQVKVNEEIELESGVQTLYFKAECDFQRQADFARFFWSVDGKQWRSIGADLKMVYTLPHFTGYRFALYNQATESVGGYVDFDYFRIDN